MSFFLVLTDDVFVCVGASQGSTFVYQDSATADSPINTDGCVTFHQGLQTTLTVAWIIFVGVPCLCTCGMLLVCNKK